MSLITCKECGHKVSSKATSCPSCGVPRRSLLAKFLRFIMIVIVIPAGVVVGFSLYLYKTKPPEPQVSYSTAKEPELPEWKVFTSTDVMSGNLSWFTTSPVSVPVTPLAEPYQAMTAWMGVGCRGREEWAYVGFSIQPHLVRTEEGDHIGSLNTRLKWDNEITRVDLIQDWGGTFLHFIDDKNQIENMMKSHRAMLELDLIGQEPVYFEFSLRGSGGAVEEIRLECAA